jgi:hypothetical protein
MKSMVSSLRACVAIGGALAASVFGVSSASAEESLLAKAPPCGSGAYEQPFLPWLDSAYYVLAPGGDMEGKTTGWNLSGGAKRVSGNESYFVGGAEDSRSLSLPSGSSATTRPMCIGVEYPTMRFFARNSGSATSTLKVEVIFETSTGVKTLPIAFVSGTSTWKPTLPILIWANLVALTSEVNQTAVSFRFTPQGADSGWRIDDVYVDPYRMR